MIIFIIGAILIVVLALFTLTAIIKAAKAQRKTEEIE